VRVTADLKSSFTQRFALFLRKQRRQLFFVEVNKRDNSAQHTRALGLSPFAPNGKSLLSRVDCLARVFGGPARSSIDRFAGGRVEDFD
jgi:hypothetical protein